MPTVRSFLDLSNVHLPPRFFQEGCDLTGRYLTEHGMLLWVPDSPDEIANLGASDESDDNAPEVLAVRRYARAHGCDYILFDSDGPEEPDLPGFEDAWGRDPAPAATEPDHAPGTVRHLTCACCGASAGRWAQHANRDTGFGLCVACARWLRSERDGKPPRYTEDEMRSLYGIPGVNYEDPNGVTP